MRPLGIELFIFTHLSVLQVLRDGQLQGGCDRRQQAQGGDPPRGGHDQQVQEREPDDVRLGDQRPTPH